LPTGEKKQCQARVNYFVKGCNLTSKSFTRAALRRKTAATFVTPITAKHAQRRVE
jgi:hypothetical protein